MIREFIQRKEKQILENSELAVADIEKNWTDFVLKETYLTYLEKETLLDLWNKAKIETKIPWYFFWHLKLKSGLRDNYSKLDEFKTKIENFNTEFVSKRKQEYHNLFSISQKSQQTKLSDIEITAREEFLDDAQQTAIITDDKYNLVVAGAGAGKTEVLTTRIAYLIKRKDSIKPNKILALAFQNKAAKEIKERLKERYGLEVEIKTFHSLGKKIIEDYSKIKGINAPKLKEECATEKKYNKYIQTLFEKELAKNKDLKNKIINFMKHFNDTELIKEETDFEKKEDFYKYQRDLNYHALDGTKVRSKAERAILNFFLMHKLNGKKIKVIYEKRADWMKYKNKNGKERTPEPDFFFPDFDIYLEHWALNKNGKAPAWFDGDNPTERYKEGMEKKKKKFEEQKKYKIIETFSWEFNENGFMDKLQKRFLKLVQEKGNLEPISYKELVERVWENKESVNSIPVNIARFIVIAKTNHMYPADITARLGNEKWSPRQESFAKVANIIYKKYQQELEEGNYIDFADMINLATDYLKQNKDFYKDKYDHILVDEYQDMSTQRYELISELLQKNPHCKLFCVGDDWQSIMGFAGSNLDFFINFSKYFPNPARTDLEKNYRSIKSIVETGANIVKNNGEGQIKKKTISNSEETRPILVYSSLHKKDYRDNYFDQIAKHCLETIKKYHDEKNYSYNDFMILMRITKNTKLNNAIHDYAEELKIPIEFGKIPNRFGKSPNEVSIMSVHQSKGLQAKVVILLDIVKGLQGFPCELENPDIFEPVIKNKDGLRKQEERRLFYVAVTRAKEEVMIYTQKCCESEFITEIKDFIKREDLPYEVLMGLKPSLRY